MWRRVSRQFFELHNLLHLVSCLAVQEEVALMVKTSLYTAGSGGTILKCDCGEKFIDLDGFDSGC
jgi:hypothetical protein